VNRSEQPYRSALRPMHSRVEHSGFLVQMSGAVHPGTYAIGHCGTLTNCLRHPAALIIINEGRGIRPMIACNCWVGRTRIRREVDHRCI